MKHPGPFYDDLAVAHRFPSPPAVTVDLGSVAMYRSIAGDHWAPGLDHRLGRALTGRSEPLAHPGLVLALGIGASTVATKNVIANLFYRDLTLRRPVHVGETLRTTTEVRALADAAPKPGVHPRGKAVLGIVTTADDDVVLDFERCALLPCRNDDLPGHHDDIGSVPSEVNLESFAHAVPTHWALAELPPAPSWGVGESRPDPLRDVVDNATGLVRLTHNLAATHRDASLSGSGRRLVYGGHTVALAHASLERVTNGVATLLGWHSCNHLAPVFEGDLVACEHVLVAQEPSSNGGILRAVRTTVIANPDTNPITVLDWTSVILVSGASA